MFFATGEYVDSEVTSYGTLSKTFVIDGLFIPIWTHAEEVSFGFESKELNLKGGSYYMNAWNFIRNSRYTISWYRSNKIPLPRKT